MLKHKILIRYHNLQYLFFFFWTFYTCSLASFIVREKKNNIYFFVLLKWSIQYFDKKRNSMKENAIDAENFENI